MEIPTWRLCSLLGLTFIPCFYRTDPFCNSGNASGCYARGPRDGEEGKLLILRKLIPTSSQRALANLEEATQINKIKAGDCELFHYDSC